jgi:hypothetical protein
LACGFGFSHLGRLATAFGGAKRGKTLEPKSAKIWRRTEPPQMPDWIAIPALVRFVGFYRFTLVSGEVLGSERTLLFKAPEKFPGNLCVAYKECRCIPAANSSEADLIVSLPDDKVPARASKN